MMQVYLLDHRGGRVELPPLTACKLRRTGSVPCDSFEGTFPWDGGQDPRLSQACRIQVEEEGLRRFTGVLDECRLTWDEEGGRLFLSGRGLAALLLDNEAPGQDYQVATLADILREHVIPYGIEVRRAGALPAVPDFSVSTGASQWQVLESFARYHGGVEPRFDVYGRLTVDGSVKGERRGLSGEQGPLSIQWQDRRYGVCSEVLVRDRGSLEVQKIVNQSFIDQGGRCSRVLTMPGKSAYEAMRYSGQYQLEQSYAQRSRLELVLPGTYFCEPGDEVSVTLYRPVVSGTWQVLETLTTLGPNGATVKLTLGKG